MEVSYSTSFFEAKMSKHMQGQFRNYRNIELPANMTNEQKTVTHSRNIKQDN